MKSKACAVATLVALVLITGISSAATSAPSVGDWSGHFQGVKPATMLTFSVSASGRKRVVSLFQSSGAFKAPCAITQPTPVAVIPRATVNSSGKFKAVGREETGFGEQTWTVSGTFKSKRAASGTVAIVLAPTPMKQCSFTVKWTAGSEAASPPVKRATYRGKTTSTQEAVTLHVSPNGKKLSSVTWTQAVIGGTCPGLGSERRSFTGHNVPIHHSKFTFTEHIGKITGGHGETTTESISGQFLAGHKAAGTLSTSSDIVGFGNVCKGSDTWTAHA
ncbi:MAG: hypothetical protein ABI323_02175 [Solirubrobacteraceae bacterium]